MEFARKGDPILSLVLRALRILVNVSALSLATACAAAALAAQGGRWNSRLDLLTHFAPLWLVGGMVGLLMALAIGHGWRKLGVAGLSALAVGAAGALMWQDVSRLPAILAEPAPTNVETTLKLIEFNAWERNPQPREVAEWLAREDPDVVVIPEAAPLLEREIGARTKLHIFHGSGAILATRNAPLSENVAWDARFLPGAPTEFAWVELRDPSGRPFTVVGVHCGWPIPARRAWGQDQKIAALLATQHRSNLILAGDFNSTQWSFRQQAADAAFGIERRDLMLPTWPARLPMLRGAAFPFPFLAIDHVYAGRAWRTLSVRRGPPLGSDHYPVVATFAWRSSPQSAAQ